MSEIETLRPDEVIPPPPKVPADLGYLYPNDYHPQDYTVEAELAKLSKAMEDYKRYLFWSRVTLWVAFAVSFAGLVTLLVAIAQRWGLFG